MIKEQEQIIDFSWRNEVSKLAAYLNPDYSNDLNLGILLDINQLLIDKNYSSKKDCVKAINPVVQVLYKSDKDDERGTVKIAVDVLVNIGKCFPENSRTRIEIKQVLDKVAKDSQNEITQHACEDGISDLFPQETGGRQKNLIINVKTPIIPK
jgi:hypothetical protein